MTGNAGQGYFISPEGQPGPGVLLLHSFWGLNRQVKDTANRLADSGFTVLAPDLAHGETYEDEDSALDALAEMDVNTNASLIQSSLGVLRRAARDPQTQVGILGYGSGASWALWLAARFGVEVGAVVTYYGSQNISMDQASASFLGHWAETDNITSDLEVADLGLSLQMAGREFRFEHHDGTAHGFAEEGHPSFDPKVEAVAWRHTAEFLATELGLHA